MCFLHGRSRTSATPIVRRSVACPVTSPHPFLVVLSATSVGDLTLVPPNSLRPMVVHQAPPVLGESEQEVLVVWML
jgi:hypothetical protein